MNIEQVTFIHNRNDKFSRELLALVPKNINKVDAYNNNSPPLEGFFSGEEWVRSGLEQLHGMNSGPLQWRGLPSAMIIVPAYFDVARGENVDSFIENYEFSTWAQVEGHVNEINLRSINSPPKAPPQ